MIISVNGVEKNFQVAQNSSFQDLLSSIRRHLITDQTLISAIKVDGRTVDEEDEGTAAMSISDIQSLEIFTAHPREIAEDTLQDLIKFTSHIEEFCLSAAKNLEKDGKKADLSRLLDGIQVYSDALFGVKQVLKVGVLQSVNILEADLVSIMRDLRDCFEKDQIPYVVDLLREHLTANMRQWREIGLPNLIRVRDS